jgi:hypothetical protein
MISFLYMKNMLFCSTRRLVREPNDFGRAAQRVALRRSLT